MKLFHISSILLIGSKTIGLASPYILKKIVDSITVAGSMDFTYTAIAIGALGATRFASSFLNEIRMNYVNKFIQEGVKRVSLQSFQHLHTLDLNFHKISSKNTVFAISRAIRSIESGLRFVIGFFSPIAFEFILLCAMLQFYFSPGYLANMLVTIGLYTGFTKSYSK